ncbi:MAG TPA: rod shape-determining protein MreC [Sphingobacteriaceae bacterium]|nr:rod shape-determining protein MreC [Sphingobacteriaceae bacterium]
MRNLWIFLSKYNAFFFFIIFFTISIVLLLTYNSYQNASTWNSSNKIIGQAFQQSDQFKSYLKLGATNDSLSKENAWLRNQLKSSTFNDSVERGSVNDTIHHQQYRYIVAKVVNNSINRQNNFVTINRGLRHGIKRGMGVIGPTGIVGIIRDVSDNFARIQSLLHSQSRFSASVNGNIGSLVWGDGNYDPRIAMLKDIPSHVILKRGNKVVTSGFSLFPAGLDIGTVATTNPDGGNSFLNVKVKLSTDFSALQYIYVVTDLYAEEQQALEAKEENKALQ